MLFSTSSFCGAQSRSPLTHFEKKKSFDPKTPHIDLFARFFDDHIFLTKIAVSIDSILIMLLLEIERRARFTDVVFFSPVQIEL